MSLSIGGITFKILTDNTEYKKGMSETESIRSKVSKTIAKYDYAEQKITERINKLTEERIKNEKALETAKKSNASSDAIDKLEKTINKLKISESKAINQSITLNEKRKKVYEELSRSVKKTEGSISFSLGSIVKSFSLLKSVNFLSSLPSHLKTLINDLDRLGKRAADIGMTASQLQELDHQSKLAGLSSGQLDSAIKSFNRNVSLASMGTGEAKSALESMGIALQNANGTTKTQSELLKETAYYFAENAGKAENAGLAARIFGESGTDLLRIFGQGKDVIDGVFNAQGIDEAAEAAADFNDKLEIIKNEAFKLGAVIVKGWTDVADFAHDIVGDGLGSTEAKRNWKKYQERLKKEEIARIQTEEAIARKIAEVNAKIAESDKKLFESRSSNIDKIINTKNEINNLTKEIDEVLESEGKSERYAALYQQRVEKTIQLEALEKSVAREQDAILKKKENAEKKAKEDAEKKAKDEAEKIKQKQEEQAKSYNEFLKEHELQKRIATAKYQGNEALADRIKQEAEAQKLAEQYNISIAEANKLLNEQKKIKEINEGKGKSKYSDDEVAKAKKILERGKTGTVGKKTLEDAQAIVDGKETKHNLSIFDSANKRTNQKQKRDFNRERNLNRGFDSKPTPKQAEDKKDEQSKNISSMDETLKGIQVLLADIKTLQQQAVVETSNLSKAITE